jgi:hypothetical protein
LERAATESFAKCIHFARMTEERLWAEFPVLYTETSSGRAAASFLASSSRSSDSFTR